MVFPNGSLRWAWLGACALLCGCHDFDRAYDRYCEDQSCSTDASVSTGEESDAGTDGGCDASLCLVAR